MNMTPRIYIACLAAYNAGYLHGEWIDVDDVDSIMKNINRILEKSPIPDAEEWAIHDYENFGNILISEYESIESVVEIADLINQYGKLFIEAYGYCNDINDAVEMVTERYLGCYDSVAEYAEEITDISQVPEYLQYYIDFETLARDMVLGGDIIVLNESYSSVDIFLS